MLGVMALIAVLGVMLIVAFAVLESALALAVVVVREVACGVGAGVEFGQFGFGLHPYAPWVRQ